METKDKDLEWHLMMNERLAAIEKSRSDMDKNNADIKKTQSDIHKTLSEIGQISSDIQKTKSDMEKNQSYIKFTDKKEKWYGFTIWIALIGLGVALGKFFIK